MNEDLKPLDNTPHKSTALLADLKDIISRGKLQAVAAVNSTLTLTYWHVGQRINDEVLKGERAAYGKQVIPSLATTLVERFGRSFETRNLRRMMQFAEVFPDFGIVSPAVSQVERDLIIDTLQHYLGNRTHAANILGISIRTLRNKLKLYNEQGFDVPMPGDAEHSVT